MLISLLMDLMSIYSNSTLPLTIIANKGFITVICAAVSSYLLYILLNKEESPEIYGFGISKNLYRVIALILLFLSGVLEINHQFGYYYPKSNLNILYLMLYVPVFVYVFNVISSRMHSVNFNWILAIVFLSCTIVLYLILSPLIFNLQQDMLEIQKNTSSHLTARWISDLFIGLIFYQVINYCRDYFEEEMQVVACWLISGAIVLFLSLELSLVSNLVFYSKTNSIDLIETVYIKTALPVLWGLISFILMWTGMRNKRRVLRIISLTLFLITLLKLFLFDINDIPVAGKIAAFFCLGVLLLIISFMYQKVKKIIVDDKGKSKD